MKRTIFFIAVWDPKTHSPAAKAVNGFFEYVGGLPLGFHKGPGKSAVWTVTELSTGCKITEGRTRADAYENARPHLDEIRMKITDKKMEKLRGIISAAYAN